MPAVTPDDALAPGVVNAARVDIFATKKAVAHVPSAK